MSVFSGELFLGKEVGENAFSSVGETAKFEMGAPETNRIEQTSKKPETLGEIVCSVAIASIQTVSVTLETWNRRNMMLAFLGNDSDIAVVAGAVATGNYNAYLGYNIDLGYTYVSSVVVTDVGAITTYVEGTDYTVDLSKGFVLPLATGAITELEILEISFDYSAANGYAIQGSKKSQITVPVLFRGENRCDNTKEVEILIYSASIIPSAGYDFLSEDFIPIELEMKLNLLPDKTETFVMKQRDKP